MTSPVSVGSITRDGRETVVVGTDRFGAGMFGTIGSTSPAPLGGRDVAPSAVHPRDGAARTARGAALTETILSRISSILRSEDPETKVGGRSTSLDTRQSGRELREIL